MTPFDRARAYLDKLDPAISGSGGHNATFKAACKLVEFGLPEEDAFTLLRDYNARCQPPWPEKDLRHKLRDAYARATPGKKLVEGRAPRPGAPMAARASNPLPTPSPAPQKPAAPPARYAVAPSDLPEPIEDGTRILISTLFAPDEGVRIAKGTINEEGKEVPEDDGLVLPAKSWIERLDKAGGNPNGIWTSAKGAGVFVTVNPMRVGGSRDADVTDFRHALLEWDHMDLEEQWAVIHASNVPCAAIIYSAGKSIHAWVKIEAKDRQEYDERVRVLHAHFANYRPDEKNKNPSRFSRLPGAKRKGRHQQLLSLACGAASWAEWHAGLQADGIGTVMTVDELENYDTANDANTLLGKRWLCKGGSCLLVGPSGVGKSSLAMQFAAGWAVGRPVFGISPVRPLKVLVVQAENDEGDLAEQINGVREGMGLDVFSSPPPETLDLLRKNLVFVRDTTHTGQRFAEAIRILVEKHRPDIVVFDPLLSFVGGDISKQEVCSQFLRGWLNPISEATGVAWFAIHHTGKPPSDKDARKGWQSSDWSYAGIGSSELTNWTRASMVLRQTGPGAFQLMLPKRGGRAGATHPDGEPTTVVWLRHAEGRIHWEQVQPPEATEDDREGGKERSEGPSGPKGRPSKVQYVLGALPWPEFVAQIPSEGWGRNEAVRQAENWLATRGHDISKTQIRDGLLAALVSSKRLSKVDGKYLKP